MGFIDLNFASSIAVRSQLLLVSLWTPAAASYQFESKVTKIHKRLSIQCYIYDSKGHEKYFHNVTV